MSSYSLPKQRVCILLLNWNGWKDTIECLESVYRLEQANYEVVVCDNASGDESIEKVEAWAAGELHVSGANPEMITFISPAISKPITVRRFDTPEAAISSALVPGREHAKLTLIQTGANLGFAGGNNCGLRYALARKDFDYVWLLNNDTVVTADALSALLAGMETDPLLGICGSTLRDYWSPSRVHVHGGKFYSIWNGRVRANHEEAADIDYVDGASMLVSCAFLQRAGLMDESYFLYFEELSWAQAAHLTGFKIGFSARSVVYHKEGASSKIDPSDYTLSLTAERFLARNRIYFTRRFHPWALPTVSAWISLSAMRAIFKLDWQRARIILNGMVEGYRLRLP